MLVMGVDGGRVGECAPQREREGGRGGVDVEEVPRPEIKYHQYLSSRAKCSDVLSAPALSTPGMTRRRL